jgi:hypothetical protein
MKQYEKSDGNSALDILAVTIQTTAAQELEEQNTKLNSLII